jgi:putative ABC transport system permease protein
MGDLIQDLRFGLRVLGRSRSFTIAAVLALALGIGGTTTMFTLLDRVLLRPLPYPRSDRLVAVWETVRRQAVERRSVAYANFEDWRAQARSFSSLAAFEDEDFSLALDGESERVRGEIASAGYFELLGVAPALGRTFAASEDARDPATAVVILSNAFWTRRLGSDPAVVGRRVVVDELPATVVGIMPPGFKGLSDDAELWVAFTGPLGAPRRPARLARYSRWHQVVGRLRDGVSLEAARAEMDTLAARLEAAWPADNRNRGAQVVSLAEDMFGSLRRALLVLASAVALVLAIACADVANLLLARAATRRREMALRAAIGASRRRLVRQLLTESVLLSLLGAASGLALASWSLSLLQTANPLALPGFVHLGLDWRVLGVTTGIAVLTGLAFGVAPALAASDIGLLGQPQRAAGLYESLKEGARGGSARSHRARHLLITAEVALALVLLMAAGLLLRSLDGLRRFDPGFRADGLASARLTLPALRYDEPRAAAFAEELRARVRALPGVSAVALSSDVPLAGGSSATLVTIEGRPDQTQDGGIRVYRHLVSDGFFAAMGTAIRRGREFTREDTDRGPHAGVAVISESMARRFWPGGDPVGQRLRVGSTGVTSSRGRTWDSVLIVGVAADLKHRRLIEAATADPDLYLPFAQLPARTFSLLARAEGEAVAVDTLRREVRAVDAAVPLSDVRTMRELLRGQTAGARFNAALLAAFAAVALILATVGVYGVVGYAVAQQTREIGTRMALGARPRDVVRMVVGQGFHPVAVGLAAGTVAAVGCTRVLQGLLVGVGPTDLPTLAVAGAVLAATAVLAAYVPARRASRLDPVAALRSE